MSSDEIIAKVICIFTCGDETIDNSGPAALVQVSTTTSSALNSVTDQSSPFAVKPTDSDSGIDNLPLLVTTDPAEISQRETPEDSILTAIWIAILLLHIVSIALNSGYAVCLVKRRFRSLTASPKRKMSIDPIFIRRDSITSTSPLDVFLEKMHIYHPTKFLYISFVLSLFCIITSCADIFAIISEHYSSPACVLIFYILCIIIALLPCVFIRSTFKIGRNCAFCYVIAHTIFVSAIFNYVFHLRRGLILGSFLILVVLSCETVLLYFPKRNRLELMIATNGTEHLSYLTWYLLLIMTSMSITLLIELLWAPEDSKLFFFAESTGRVFFTLLHLGYFVHTVYGMGSPAKIGVIDYKHRRPSIESIPEKY